MANSRKSSERKDKPSFLKLLLGLTLLLVGIFIVFQREKGNAYLSSTFKDEPVKFEELILNGEAKGDIPQRILIPKLEIDLEVRKAKVVNGYWEVFNEVAGWGEGSGVPGQKGNQVIFAHAKEGLFLPLRSIKVGDVIYVLVKDKYYKYSVSEVKEVNPGETEVIKGGDDEILTLYTCSGFADSKRLISKAIRI